MICTTDDGVRLAYEVDGPEDGPTLVLSSDGYVGCSAALRDADLRALTDRVRVPTLVIVGSHDVSTPPTEGTWISARIAGARLVELDAAHLSNVECAEEFSSAVATFLASEESGHG